VPAIIAGSRYDIPLMNAKMKKVLFVLGGGAVALVMAVVIFALTFNINSYRSRIEAAASGATGLEVRINGKMGLSFFPFGISAKDIRVANKGGEFRNVSDLMHLIHMIYFYCNKPIFGDLLHPMGK
jgi:hypothetical protein